MECVLLSIFFIFMYSNAIYRKVVIFFFLENYFVIKEFFYVVVIRVYVVYGLWVVGCGSSWGLWF